MDLQQRQRKMMMMELSNQLSESYFILLTPVQQAELVVDAHALAEEVANKLSTMFETLQTPKQKHKDSTGWGIFFEGGNKE